MTDADILAIDAKILRNFDQEETKIPEYKEKLKSIHKALQSNKIRDKTRKDLIQANSSLSDHLVDLKGQISKNFYIAESIELIEAYKKILEIPRRISFMGKASGDDKGKKDVITTYLAIAQKYVEIDIVPTQKSAKIVCAECQNKKEFDVLDNDIYVCLECFAQQIVSRHRSSSYNDIDRVNISSKYMYDRKVHFRDCINQYQGKQNSTVPQEVYDNLEKEFIRHHLMPENHEILPREEMFKNIKKEHILMFLRELEYTKHYENLHLIHYNFTGIKPDDISHLEDALLDDFDALTELYDKHFRHNSRKNFINTQYVLYQLLTRHKHPCKMRDFTILKTIDRKAFHDDVARVLFNKLGWNFQPLGLNHDLKLK